jgi:hypothetical protein
MEGGLLYRGMSVLLPERHSGMKCMGSSSLRCKRVRQEDKAEATEERLTFHTMMIVIHSVLDSMVYVPCLTFRSQLLLRRLLGATDFYYSVEFTTKVCPCLCPAPPIHA